MKTATASDAPVVTVLTGACSAARARALRQIFLRALPLTPFPCATTQTSFVQVMMKRPTGRRSGSTSCQSIISRIRSVAVVAGVLVVVVAVVGVAGVAAAGGAAAAAGFHEGDAAAGGRLMGGSAIVMAGWAAVDRQSAPLRNKSAPLISCEYLQGLTSRRVSVPRTNKNRGLLTLPPHDTRDVNIALREEARFTCVEGEDSCSIPNDAPRDAWPNAAIKTRHAARLQNVAQRLERAAPVTSTLPQTLEGLEWPREYPPTGRSHTPLQKWTNDRRCEDQRRVPIRRVDDDEKCAERNVQAAPRQREARVEFSRVRPRSAELGAHLEQLQRRLNYGSRAGRDRATDEDAHLEARCPRDRCSSPRLVFQERMRKRVRAELETPVEDAPNERRR